MHRSTGLRRVSRTHSSALKRFRPQIEVLEERQLLTAVPMLLKDLSPGGSNGNPAGFTEVGDTIYFGASDKLWKTDGTTAGTVALLNNAELGSMAELNGKLIFSGPGRELWTSDGTPEGTQLLIDLNPSGGSGFNPNSGPTEFTNINGTMFFAARHPTYGFELWKTDGTAAGTVFVADTSSLDGTQNQYLRSFTNVNGTLFFRQHDGVHGWELWKSDGTAAGTMMVADINPTGDATPAGLTVVDDKLYFSADDGVHGTELWTSDGTPGGTQMVADINPGSGSSAVYSFQGHSITQVDGMVYLAANDGTHGLELWKSDGTAANTQLVKDINPGAAGAFREDSTAKLLEYNGALVMVANDGTTGLELWKSDGSAAGTQLVKDIWPGPEARVWEMMNGNGILYLSADDGTLGRELWISDATPAGTYLLSDVYPGPTESLASRLTYFKNGLLFAGYGPSVGYELWIVPGLFVDLDNTTVESGSTAVWYNSPVPIAAPTATIDYWGTELISMSAMLTAPLDGDVLAADTSGTAITASFDGTTLLLSGADSLANYQQVLRSITYDNTLGRPPLINGTTVLVSAVDAHNTPTNVATATIILNEKPVIDLNGPVVDGLTFSTTWANAPRPIASSASTVSDSDGTNLLGLTALITNFQAGDLLAANTTGTSIAASYLNGLLTLSGEDTLANYQQVLRSITYHRADMPTGTYKTILVQATDELGQLGFESTSNVFINQPPTVIVQSSANWEGVPKLLVPDAEVTDDATMTSLSVWLETPVAGDVLSVTVGASGLSASFDGTTLLLSGNKTAAVYQQVLRTLTYHNTNGPIPSQLGHRVSFQGVDHTGVYGNIDVLFLTTARLPEIDLNGPDEGLTYAGTWAGSPVSVTSPAATFVNPDEVPLARVTATLNTTRAGDVLTADTTGTSLTATFSSRELRITGTGTSADYQQVLRTIKYHNTVGTTNVGQYTVDIRATLGTFGPVVRSTANISSTITIASAKVDLNGPLSGTGFDSMWTGDGPSYIAAPDATLTSDLVPNLNALIVTITNPQVGDVLSATPPGNISVSYNGSYEMVLNGIDSVANYEAALRSITYDSTVLTPNTLSRTINVVAHNGVSPGPTAVAKVTRAINNVASSKLYYRQSSWNSTIGQPGTHADDNAIAPDKTPYLPGSGPATFASISSYTRGINGLMIDIAGPVGSLTSSDFVFKIGNNNAPSTWAIAPNPNVTVRAGAGVGGSNRVQLTWTANTISKTWLEITVLPTAKTGLADSYVMYWGSNPGNTGQGDNPQRAVTNTTDELATRNNPSNSVPITSPLDFDRSKQVNTTDSLAARNNAGFIWKINIGAPELASAAVVPAAAPLAEGGEISAGLAASTASTAPIASTPVWYTGHLQRVDAVATSAPQGPTTLLANDGGRLRAVAKSVDRLLASHALDAEALETLLDELLGR